jgi:hypothetical protein
MEKNLKVLKTLICNVITLNDMHIKEMNTFDVVYSEIERIGEYLRNSSDELKNHVKKVFLPESIMPIITTLQKIKNDIMNIDTNNNDETKDIIFKEYCISCLQLNALNTIVSIIEVSVLQ